MRFHQVLFSTFLSLSLTSCGNFSYSLSPASQSWIPEEMYYQTDGNCENGDLVFKILVAGGTKLWTDPQQLLVGQTDLYLNKDGTYSVRYREFANLENSPSFETQFSEKYQVNSDTGEIYFVNLGYGNVITRQGKYFLDFQYSVNINSQELQGKQVRFRLTETLRGFNTDRAQYCNY
ncbi:hypothetical protein [Bdellovibrio bacteriovorus]|uniref:hypothetical protein n=1 Tax=Bdellovibrio TaxID=958 RepID=UPI0035A9A45A